MTARRSLVEGIKPDPALEQQFVHTGKVDRPEAVQPAEDQPAPREAKPRGAKAVSRAPLTTRIRSDFAAALKRASLERQLNGITPNTLQDILEEALEPWLRKNSYLQ
jgi:hypothetical protein